jgi:glucose-1-phosphate thymidylyltransferase
MKALVLSGGSGTRLRPLSHTMPKQLIPVAGKPVLVHCLENLAEIGVVDVGLIVGDRATDLRAIVGDGERLGLRITYIHQHAPLGLAHCVRIARDFLGDDDFVMYLGDNILVGGIAEAANDFRGQRGAARILLTKVANPSEFGVAELAPDGSVLRLTEKPAHPRSDMALAGVYFFTPTVHEAVAAIEPSARGELEITDAISWLLDHGHGVEASEFRGYWKDTGRIDDVLECNRVLMERLRGDLRGEVDETSHLYGDVVVERGARVIGSSIRGPAIIGTGTVVAGSRIGPYPALGRDCHLAGSSIEYSIVLDGVSVRDVHGIYGSMIGRQADITSAPDEAHRRLVIGDHAKVEVS